MLEDKKTLERIEVLRKKLNNKIISADNLLDLEVLALSEELDLLIVAYNLYKRKNKEFNIKEEKT